MSLSKSVVLCTYDPRWVDIYRRESAILAGLLGESLFEIHHFGSTAVLGLLAKPVVDILAVVDSLANLDTYRAALESAGYIWKGENGIAGRRYFDKEDPQSQMELVHLHCYPTGHPKIAVELAFRDYLRNHRQVAEEYSRLKTTLAKRFRHDRKAYTEGKAAFIESILAIIRGEKH